MGIFDYFKNKKKQKEKEERERELKKRLAAKVSQWNKKPKQCDTTDMTEVTLEDGKKISIPKVTLEDTDPLFEIEDITEDKTDIIDKRKHTKAKPTLGR